MSEKFTSEYLQDNLDIPKEIIPFACVTPQLLPGESRDDYFLLFEMIVLEILPDTEMEWLWAIDLAWVWFDIHRYRCWKNAIIRIGRRAALESALLETSPEALPVGEVNPLIRAQARIDAKVLLVETNRDDKLSTRLEAHGYDTDTVNAMAFIQGLQPLTMIERFLVAARRQATIMLRDVGLHRDFARRAKQMHLRQLDQLEARHKSTEAETKPS